MYIENESTGKYTCSHTPYTRFTSVFFEICEEWGLIEWNQGQRSE